MENLTSILTRIDRRGYKAYKELRGSYRFPDFRLRVDHVQGDPFAEPSRLAVEVPLEATWLAELTGGQLVAGVALRDYVTRAFGNAIRSTARQRRGSGKSGLVTIDRPGQEILDRSSCLLRNDTIEVRFRAGLPAAGRSVLSREAREMLCDEIPRIVERALLHDDGHAERARAFIECAEDAAFLRRKLPELGLVAFVAEGAVLPRRSGVDDRPMESGAVPFGPAPEALRSEVDLPHAGRVAGLGIAHGVTLIVGGGYHGKSTLLTALAAGIYDHIPGDGRELTVTDGGAVMIRSEDGRRIEKVDISPFITDLPFGKSTTAFSTDDASGSTSQAANIVEALEAGATTLIVDEDTSANNFMIRDHRMQLLVAKNQEPIVPFIDRVREMYQRTGVSTVLVIGGSGDYFDVADTVIQMREYRPLDVTAKAARICDEHPARRSREDRTPLSDPPPRVPLPASFDPSKGRRDEKVRSMATRAILFGKEEIDISLVHQIVDPSQTRFIADAILHINRYLVDGKCSLPELLEKLRADFDRGGFDSLSKDAFGNRAAARPIEVAAAINRLRTLVVKGEG
jgi:predicted ABC-class ATPase